LPVYSFINDNTGETKDIVMTMTEDHRYVDESGYEWRRIFCVPQAAIDANADISNKNVFLQKTGKQTGKMKDLYEQSQEASAKREKRYGADPVKKKYFENWSKVRKGKKHPQDPSRYV
jgi:hypothetical protein